VLFEANVAADGDGYVEALRLVRRQAPGRRGFAIEGTASYGADLSRFLLDHDEQVFEVGRPRRGRRLGGKTDALDAIRAVRSVLTQKRAVIPRSSGEREALRALMAAREGAAVAKQAGLNQLYALVVTTPEPLRAELGALTRARLLNRLAASRPDNRRDPELRGTLLALRAVARRVQHLTAEERQLAREIDKLVRTLSHHSYSTSQVSARSWQLRSSSPGHIPDDLPTRPPSPGSPASRRSQRRPAKRSATASIAAATEN
jgi:hypothetical protein